MSSTKNIQWAIAFACVLFIGILFISAYWDPTIRWLHFVQALLYVAIGFLALRGNRWGYFLGISTAAFWNYLVLFVNSFYRSGREQLEVWLSTGTLPRPDNFIAIPAFCIHLLVIALCLLAYSRARDRHWTDVARFFVSAGISLGYFAAIVAILQPRYLPMFRLLLHPNFNY